MFLLVLRARENPVDETPESLDNSRCGRTGCIYLDRQSGYCFIPLKDAGFPDERP